MAIIDNPITAGGADTLVKMLEGRTSLQMALAYSSITEVPMFKVNSAVTSMASFCNGCPSLVSCPLINTSKCTTLSTMFLDCTSLNNVALLNTAAATSFSSMFSGCTSLVTVPALNLAKGTQLNKMFQGCSSLENVPQFNLKGASGSTSIQNTFDGCTSLTNTSLNNILASLATWKGTSNKTLKYIGLTSTQATTCTSLSNWSALSTAGWTTGY